MHASRGSLSPEPAPDEHDAALTRDGDASARIVASAATDDAVSNDIPPSTDAPAVTVHAHTDEQRHAHLSHNASAKPDPDERGGIHRKDQAGVPSMQQPVSAMHTAGWPNM